MRHLFIAFVLNLIMTAVAAFLGWYRSASLPALIVQPAHCASCPDWPCVTQTSCGGSVSSGCMCLVRAHEQLGVCVSKAYYDSVRGRGSPVDGH